MSLGTISFQTLTFQVEKLYNSWDRIEWCLGKENRLKKWNTEHKGKHSCEVLRNKSEDSQNVKEEMGCAKLGCNADKCQYKCNIY